MSDRHDLRIAIIGAGMGGLTAALALQKFGYSPRIYEQASILGEIGAGLTVSPNSSRILDFLGLEAELQEIGYTPERQLVRHYSTGKIMLEIPRGDLPRKQYGAGYYFVHRADLHDLLVRKILANDPDGILLGAKLDDVEPRDDGVRVIFADGQIVECDVLIGADGVRSAVRASAFEKTGAKFTGHVAWRGLVPRERLPQTVLDSPPGIHVGPGQLFMRYPLRHGALMNYAAFAHDESWTNESWSARADVADVVAAFEGWDHLALDIIKATPPDGCFKWALLTRDPLPTWRNGRVTLLGDAAHAMLPFLGQGAAISIEDGLVLARCIEQFDDVTEALIRYENTRRDRATFIQSKARSIVEHLQNAHPDRFSDTKFENEEALGLFNYDATTVAL